MNNNLPRGLRNNNPLNMRIGDGSFSGEIKPSKDPGFRQFETMAHGYRAAFRQMELFLERDGLDNIDKIIHKWSPPTENNTRSYVAAVESFSGVSRHKTLSFSSGEELIKIVAAMSYIENGTQAIMSDVTAGFALQDKITIKR